MVMVEQRFYQSQPDVLPKTLPKGTRFKYGDVAWLAQETMILKEGSVMYIGPIRAGKNRDSMAQARYVDWTSVPLSEPADRPIQAADWVECVNAYLRWNRGLAPELTLGARN